MRRLSSLPKTRNPGFAGEIVLVLVVGLLMWSIVCSLQEAFCGQHFEAVKTGDLFGKA